jgi:hypothetical protein
MLYTCTLGCVLTALSCAPSPQVTQFKARFEKVEDIQWLTDFAKWLQNPMSVASSDQNPTDGWVWWVWNANSGEPDSILSKDWQNLEWSKVRPACRW